MPTDKITEMLGLVMNELTPREMYAFQQMMEDVVREAEYPQLVVGTDDDGATVLLDPDTGEEVSLISVDVSYRWTSPERINAFEEEDSVVYFNYDGSGEFNGFVYLSEDTLQPVRLPEGWVEETL